MFQSLDGLSKAITLFFGIAILGYGGMIAFSVVENAMLMRLIDREFIPDADIDNFYRSLQIFSIVYIVVYLLCIVLFLVWQARAHGNLDSMARQSPYTVGWGIGYWFIPIVNLFRPYQLIRDIWEVSVEHAGHNVSSALIGWWWAAFILGSIFSQAGDRLYGNGSLYSDFVTANNVLMVGELIMIAAAVMAILIVRRISRMQKETFNTSMFD